MNQRINRWGNLVVANGYEQLTSGTDAKTPDFRVLYEGESHNVEVKALSLSDYEDERFALSMELSSQLLALRPVPRHQITLKAQASLKAALDRTDAAVLRSLAPMLRAEARSLVKLAKASPTPLRHVGARLLELELSPAPDLESGAYGEAALPPDRDGRVEERALRLITKAAQQVAIGNGVIVIDLVSQGVRPEQLRDAVRAKQAARPGAFVGTDVVVIRGSGVDQDGLPVRYAYVFSVTGAQLSPLHHEIAKFLPFRRFGNPTMVRPRPRGPLAPE